MVCLYILILGSSVMITLCIFPDFNSKQTPSGVDGWSDSQSFPYIQCLNYPAAAGEGADKRYV